MTVVDVEYEVYRCPHCSGYLVIREQYPYDGCGCSVSIQHYTELPDWLRRETENRVEYITMEEGV